jgi:3-oxoacyl-[acyl-carrier-protein] synthase II
MRERPHRRVVITGMGVIAPNGLTLDEFWRTIRRGESAANLVTRFDTSHVPNKIAAEIQQFEVGDYMEKKKGKRFDLSVQYGIAASRLAVDDARINFESIDPDRVGVIEGTSVSGMEASFKGQTAYEGKGYRSMSAFTMINAYSGGGSGEIALELGIRGHAVTYSSGSASGSDIIGYAMNMVRSDEVDVMVAGGTEAPLLAPLWGAFCLVQVMTSRNSTPKDAMRPFDKTRDGFLLGEGAAFLILEDLAHALGRGAKIYAEVAGHGRSVEAYHSVSPHPEGLGMARAIEKALHDSDVHPGEVEYMNVHGTATSANDLAETKAILRYFGEHSKRIAVSSTKPVTGHLLAAAGALETVISALAIDRSEIPMTANHRDPAPGCTLDYVKERSRPYPLKTVLNTNVGFGGKNSCLVLRRYPQG